MKKIYLLTLTCFLALGAMSQKVNLIVPKLDPGVAPVLDGKIGASECWNNISASGITNYDKTYPATMDPGDSAYLKAAWNDTTFFLLVYVPDDHYCPPACTGLKNYESDRIEVYFDANTWPGGKQPGAQFGSKKGVYQFTSDSPNGTDTFAHYTGWQAGLYTEAGHVDGDTYAFEFAFPWTSLNDSAGNQVSAAVGLKMGFDTYVLDRDPGDDMSSDNTRKWVYWHAGGCWDDMSVVGTIQLADDLGRTSINSANIDEFTISPNPASGFINIKADFKFSEVRISNLTGQVVMDVLNLSGNRLDISGIKQNGLYFVTLINNGQIKGISKMVIH